MPKVSNYPPAYASIPHTGQRRTIRRSDIFLVLCITVMLLWPWIFFGQVWVRGGIQMNNALAIFVLLNPHNVTFFLTFLGTVVRLVVGYIFAQAIIRYSQERMTENHLNLFHISLILGFKNQKLPWGPGDLGYLWNSKTRWLRVALVVICWGIFTVVPSSTSSLLSPVPFNKTVNIEGAELDLSPTAADCIAWLNDNIQLDQCGWTTYINRRYSTCLGENQLLDVLESGRGNILARLTQNQEVFFLNQVGLAFVGPVRGVLPIGPGSIPGFNNTPITPLSNGQTWEGVVSYDYTLLNQGLYSQFNCGYASQSPINVFVLPGDTSGLLIQYSGTCDAPGETNILEDNTIFKVINSTNGLAFWACRSLSSEGAPSYSIYLRGLQNYATEIGNITCTISLQPAVFPVTYQAVDNTFSVGEPAPLVNATTFSAFIGKSIAVLGNLVAESQNQRDNLVAESVFTYGVKFIGLSETGQSPLYPQLYAAMIQGIMEYLATYARFLYSIAPNRPDSCTSPAIGNMTYQVMGWSVTPDHIGFLMPLTIVNLVSLVIMVLVILGTTSGSYKDDPVSPKSLMLAEHHIQEDDPTGWKDYAIYRERQVQNQEDYELQS